MNRIRPAVIGSLLALVVGNHHDGPCGNSHYESHSQICNVGRPDHGTIGGHNIGPRAEFRYDDWRHDHSTDRRYDHSTTTVNRRSTNPLDVRETRSSARRKACGAFGYLVVRLDWPNAPRACRTHHKLPRSRPARGPRRHRRGDDDPLAPGTVGSVTNLS